MQAGGTPDALQPTVSKILNRTRGFGEKRTS